MQSRYREFSYAWRVVIASALGIGLGMSPIPIYTLGVFAAPLAEEFGWGFDQIFLALPVLTICAFALSPIVGLIIDRIGVRPVALFGVIGFGLSLMLHALNPGSYTMYLLTWVVVALLGVGTLPITWTRVINNWFSDCRGLALGCALVGTGFFGVFVKFYVAEIIDLAGWRTAFVALGALPLIISLPVAIFLFRDVDDPKVAPEKRPAHSNVGGVATNTLGMTPREVFRDWRFYLMCFSFITISFGVGGLFPNLENLLQSKGFGREQAIQIAGLAGVSVVIGRLVGGFLIDRIWAPAIAAVLLITPALSCYFLMQGQLTYAAASMAILLVGLAAGAEQDLMAFLVSRYFGMKSYGLVYGSIYASFALGAGFGPWYLGRIFEQTGSYNSALVYCGVAFVIGALPLLALGKYRNFSQSTQTES